MIRLLIWEKVDWPAISLVWILEVGRILIFFSEWFFIFVVYFSYVHSFLYWSDYYFSYVHSYLIVVRIFDFSVILKGNFYSFITRSKLNNFNEVHCIEKNTVSL